MQISNLNTRRNQTGMTFWGTLLVLTALILVGTVGVKSFPAYMEFRAVKQALNNIAEQDLSTISKQDIRNKFNREAAATYITSVSGRDVVVQGRHLSVNYQKVIPLFFNISLLLDFEAKSNG